MRPGLILMIALVLAAASPAAEQQPPEPPAPVGLESYRLAREPVRIKGVGDNASGLAYSPVTKTLFVVLNSPTVVVELSLEGVPRRFIPLRGFSDTEGIAHVNGDAFVIAEEGRQTLVLVRIGPDTEAVDYASCRKIVLDPRSGGNQGIEGVACDPNPKKRRFFAVKEKGPRRIYRLVEVPEEGPTPKVEQPWDIEKQSLGMRDLSDVYYHAPTGHLLILSHESYCAVECTVEGKEISRMSLDDGESGLEEGPPKPEGITMDAAGVLYICSEPNLLYVFSKPEE